ncbi:MAG: pyridoxamine 5'-phosphate oxidase family protein [Alphaproteobacteria bacterium]|nr:pyridoxamine 5'-phosphate oxidase family protein [Alphaproteobacteria bacterium]
MDEDVKLREIYDAPSRIAVAKCLPALDRHCRDFIALSPFLVIGTSRGDGSQDVSPRGDPPGFVRVIDERTLAIPDRPGNNRLDSLGNIQDNPRVGLIFFIPGVEETLRVNGRARISLDADLLAGMAVQGKPPRSALIVEVEECYLHCAKALKRARLWGAEHRIERSRLPTLGQMVADQTGLEKAEEADRRLEESYRTRLY